ncbi:MAG: DUF411 domain-containing protein [Gemmatimonadaceae bacterium]
MRDNGFQVTAIDEPARVLGSIKTAHGITSETASCHTAEVGKYVIEGHVPADLVQKLVSEHPADIVGLTARRRPCRCHGCDAPFGSRRSGSSAMKPLNFHQ